MTPLQIEVLLHYHTCELVFPRFDAPAVQDAISWFVAHDLITSSLEPGCYHTTERGKTLVTLLCSIPFPQQQWVDQHGNVIPPS